MLSNKKIKPMVAELSHRGRKVNIYLVFITQSYFDLPKNNRTLNCMHYFVMKFPNKRELQRFSNFNCIMNLYKKCTAKSYSFLVIDATLASDNTSRFRKNLLGRI